MVGQVIIVGAGIAGATAALRLAERGYSVVLYERDPEAGGQFRAVESSPVRHEHCYHLFDAWYHNFWEITDELGVRDRFKPLYGVQYLRPGDLNNMMELRDVGSIQSFVRNVFSGVLSPADMYLFLYSYIDLLASNLDRRRYRELVSTIGFLYSRLYVTDQSARMHDNLLLKAFGVPGFDESAQSYRKFIGFHAVDPSPMFYVMKGDVYNNFWAPLLNRLKELKVEIRYEHDLRRLVVDDKGRISSLRFSKVRGFAEYREDKRNSGEFEHAVSQDSVILALPPTSLVALNDLRLTQLEPQFSCCAKLRSEPMASVHLHLNEGFAARLGARGFGELPDEPIVLLDSRFSLTVQNNTRLWPNIPKGDTYLHIVASDVRELFPVDRTTAVSINLRRADTVMDLILDEFRKYIPLEEEHIRRDQSTLDTNVKYPIFINDVGSWQYRPTTETRIANLFLAGAHCKQDIDVVTIETAVLSGLNAAEAVRIATGGSRPVTIRYPVERPAYYYWPALIAGAPLAALAKLWSELHAASGTRFSEYATDGRIHTRQSVSRDAGDLCWAFVRVYADLALLPLNVAASALSQIGYPSADRSSRPHAPPASRRVWSQGKPREWHGQQLSRGLELCCAPYIVAARVWWDAVDSLFTMHR